MFKLKYIAAVVLISSSTPSFAADAMLATPATIEALGAPFTWDGAYAGLNAGNGSGEGPSVFTVGVDAYYGGLVAGVQAGYNFKVGGVIVGVEADYQYADVRHRRDVGLGIIGVSGFESLGTVRARLGADMGSFMPYITGGVAYASMGYDFDQIDPRDTTSGWGWTAGAGIEAAVTNNLSIKTEYLYVDVRGGNVNLGGFDAKMDAFAHVARAGVNFHF